MIKRSKAMVVVGWLLCSLYAAGTLHADFQGEFPNIACKNNRHDLAFSTGYSLIFGPAAAVVAFFGSGFNEYGWNLSLSCKRPSF